jgi:hypothetical protein
MTNHGRHFRVPPYVEAVPREAARHPVTAPVPGPAVVLVWPDAPDEETVQRVARALERALRAAWPPVATEQPDADSPDVA